MVRQSINSPSMHAVRLTRHYLCTDWKQLRFVDVGRQVAVEVAKTQVHQRDAGVSQIHPHIGAVGRESYTTHGKVPLMGYTDRVLSTPALCYTATGTTSAAAGTMHGGSAAQEDCSS
jgi:hypothetical protein